MGRNKRKKKAASATKPALTAKNADKYRLYEKSVQDPAFDIRFIRRVFKKESGRDPLTLREDFCGTGLFSALWVNGNRQRRAWGLDLDAKTLAYGQRTHLEPLGDAAERAQLLQRDVLEGGPEPVDVAVAFNFSYCILQTRPTLLRYFQVAREGLHPDGAFFLDIHGGPEAQMETEERKNVDGFTYVWDQQPMDAISGQAKRHIHFEFKDGSRLKRAFSYDWRVWTLPEIKDVLEEAGFQRVDVYWEGADENGEGNGIFRKVKRAQNEDSWIAYVVAWRTG